MAPSALRILVVDDSEPWRGFVCATLRNQAEFQVVGEASDGWQAAQLAQELQPDLILLDIAIPTLNGIEAAKRIRESVPNSKILFLSGNSSLDIAEAALQTGASGYVVKLDAASELLPAVRAVLQGKRFVGRGIRRASAETQDSPMAGSLLLRRGAHVVQFYADDGQLLDSLCVLVRTALDASTSAIGILTESHWKRLKELLIARGVDTREASNTGRLTVLDAIETLRSLIDANGLRRERVRLQFEEVIRRAQTATISKDVPVVVFGEMVAVLCGEGKYDAAIQLEQVADELTSTHSLYMCCAYPASEFETEPRGAFYTAVCAQHTEVVSVF